jgi:hypothetical protein
MIATFPSNKRIVFDFRKGAKTQSAAVSVKGSLRLYALCTFAPLHLWAFAGDIFLG